MSTLRAPPRTPTAPPKPEKPRKEPKPAKRGSRASSRAGGRFWPLVGKGLVLAGIWGFMLGLFALAWFAYDLPDVNKAVQVERRPAITLVAADGTQFGRLGDLRGATVDVAHLPDHLVQALIATEDRRFYSHFGVDPLGIGRALYTNWRAGRTVQGGSTLTQQLVKNLFLTPEQTLKRKIQEALLAVWLERKYTKDEILTAYLNRVYLGAGTFGVDAAARTYFNKPATELSLRESAVIVGLLKAPSRYSPTSNPRRALERAEVVLGAMVDQGFITEAQMRAALEIPAVPPRKPGSEGDARYFSAWVADQVAAFIGPDHGDLIVYTTFDPQAQRSASAHVAEMLRGPGADARVGQAAAIVMTPEGAVRAMVGGGDYDASQFNRATQALRQPGSAFKPVVYLAALEAGWTADSAILDAPYRKGKWTPENYDGKFRGTVPLTEALAQSLNTATIRLLEEVGVDRAISMARRLGVTSPMRRDLSLALGTSETTLLELTGSYAAIANGGRAIIPYAILEIRDTDGQLLYQRRGSGAGYAIAGPDVEAATRLLLGPITHGTGTAASLGGRMAAGKTGTTQDYKDAWFVGFTADLVAGVWLGNDSGAPMKRVTGGGLPARLWRDIMVEAHNGLPPRDLPALSGGIPRPAADEMVAERPDAEPRPETLERPNTDDGIGGLIARLTGTGGGR